MECTTLARARVVNRHRDSSHISARALVTISRATVFMPCRVRDNPWEGQLLEHLSLFIP